MATMNRYEEAAYRVVEEEDSLYAVEVKVPGAFPAVVRSFATAADAEAWIIEHKRQASAGGGPSRARWTKRA
jgi:hypothetical protein